MAHNMHRFRMKGYKKCSWFRILWKIAVNMVLVGMHKQSNSIQANSKISQQPWHWHLHVHLQEFPGILLHAWTLQHSAMASTIMQHNTHAQNMLRDRDTTLNDILLISTTSTSVLRRNQGLIQNSIFQHPDQDQEQRFKAKQRFEHQQIFTNKNKWRSIWRSYEEEYSDILKNSQWLTARLLQRNLCLAWYMPWPGSVHLGS